VSWDCVIVGTGLAGLTAAIRLAESGKRVVVVAKGVGSTHLGGATIDVLGYDPDPVERPAEALSRLPADHPYTLLGRARVEHAVEWLLALGGPPRLAGGLDANLRVPTALGVAKPTAVVPVTMRAGDLSDPAPIAVVGLGVLKDFYPSLLADNLRSAGHQARAIEVFPELAGEADVGALGIARQLERRPELRAELAAQLRPRLEPGERVALPAVLGLEHAEEIWHELQDRLGAPVFEVPTLPPSIAGIRLYGALRERLRRLGGRIVIGAPAIGAERDGPRVRAVLAASSARASRFEAPWFVLATGGVSAGGIEMDSHGAVREVVLDLPLSHVDGAGGQRFAPVYLDEQPFARAGVGVDAALRPVDGEGRRVLDNVVVAGAALAGAVPWREASGNGLALATGHAAAATILEEAA
jgi:glycerol-3-phosphate dehydrogenase subunit B